MKSTLQPSDEELMKGRLTVENCKLGADLLREHGSLFLPQIFSKELMSRLLEACSRNQPDWHCQEETKQIGHRRRMLSVEISAPFNDTEFYAHPICLAILRRVLGNKMIINSIGVVIAEPGAETQHIHRDHPSLFGPEEAEVWLPCYAMTLFLPLVELNRENGSMRVWQGSHVVQDSEALSMGPQRLATKLGDCFLMDYRLWHGGMQTSSSEPRPMMFITYSRPWFRDFRNFPPNHLITMTHEEYSRVPADLRPLFLLSAHSGVARP